MDLEKLKELAEKASGIMFSGTKTDEHNKDRAGRSKLYYSVFVPEAGDMWPVRIELDQGESINPVLFKWFDTANPQTVLTLISELTAAREVVKVLQNTMESFDLEGPSPEDAVITDRLHYEWLKEALERYDKVKEKQ